MYNMYTMATQFHLMDVYTSGMYAWFTETINEISLLFIGGYLTS